MELEIENKITAFKYFVHFSCLDANELSQGKLSGRALQ